MALLYWALVGLVAGWLAGKIMKGKGFGVIGNMIVGVLGAFVGGFLFRIVGFVPFTLLGSLVTATAGAVVLIWAVRLIARN